MRERLVAGLAQGTPTPDVVRQLVDDWDWPRAYSEVVVRNNLATATSAGRIVEATKVASAGIPTGFEIQTAGDGNVRPGHKPLDGLRMRVDDPILREWCPPLGPDAGASWSC